MAYKTLTLDEQNDMVVSTYYANESDLFSHTANKERFERILQGTISDPFRARIEKLLSDTNSRIAEVQAILDATIPQLPSDTEISASLTRIKSR